MAWEKAEHLFLFLKLGQENVQNLLTELRFATYNCSIAFLSYKTAK
jgi:hypothetical protein